MAPRGIVAAAVTAIFSLEFAHAVDEGRIGKEIEQLSHQMVPLVFIVIVVLVLVHERIIDADVRGLALFMCMFKAGATSLARSRNADTNIFQVMFI